MGTQIITELFQCYWWVKTPHPMVVPQVLHTTITSYTLILILVLESNTIKINAEKPIMAPLLKRYFNKYGNVDSVEEAYPGKKKSFLLSFVTATGMSKFCSLSTFYQPSYTCL